MTARQERPTLPVGKERGYSYLTVRSRFLFYSFKYLIVGYYLIYLLENVIRLNKTTTCARLQPVQAPPDLVIRPVVMITCMYRGET